MFDFDVSKLLLIGVVALIFIPPKDLPQALKLIKEEIKRKIKKIIKRKNII
jgi:Sec-independent protein translocase protein TatA